MSNQNNDQEDQAEELRRLVYDVQNNQEELNEEQDDKTETETRQIDILNLPPRKEVHGKKQSRVRLKTSTSFKRFLLVIFVLIIVLFSIYYFFGDELIQNFNI